MIAFVTGAAGFLGQQLVRRLLERGLTVRCLVRSATGTNKLQDFAAEAGENLVIVRGDLGDADALRQGMLDCDIVFHLAAALSGPPAALFADNVIGTRRLVQVALETKIKRFVLISSLAVYGCGQLPVGAVLDESCPLDPQPHLRDAYTYSKLAQERVAWQAYYDAGLPLVVVRPGVIYGPGRDPIGSRIGIRLGGLLLRMGGSQRLPYTFVENCADAIVKAGVAANIEGSAFNILDDDLPTAAEFLRRFRRLWAGIRVVPIPDGAVMPLSRLCQWYHRYSKGMLPAVLTPYKSAAFWKPLRYSNARAKQSLGWQPQVSFSEAMNALCVRTPADC